VALVARFKVDLSGFSGAPGVNTWFVGDTGLSAGPSQGTVDGTAVALDAFYEAVKGVIQSDVSWSVDPSVGVLDVETGVLDSIMAAAGGPFSGVATGINQGGHMTMIKTQLRTGSYNDGREVRGGPFIGPVVAAVADGPGTLTPAVTLTMNNALTALAGAINSAGGLLVVYRRPRAAAPGVTARAGLLRAVTSATVFNKPAVLRSRRD
jgi:hypothetical protein